MVVNARISSPTFERVAKGLVALHRLIKDGRDESPEAEAFRDELDVPLKALNPTERLRAQWLSEDLYSASEPPPATEPKALNPQAQRQLNEAFEARQSREWDRALALLRRWKEYIAPGLLSYLRGSIWLDLGHPDVAAVFYCHASECDPTNANYQAIYMHVLAQSSPDAAGKLANQVLADGERYAPVVVARAAEIRFQQTRNSSDPESARLHRKLIPILERNLARIETGADGADGTSGLPGCAMTIAVLGFCQELLGNTRAAVDFYTRGLQMNPNDDGLLVARGVLLYGTDPRSIIDFEQAVERGTSLIWPYLFLAHHHLITSRYEQCRVMCEAGLRKQGSNMSKSQLEEWRAIAQAELGFPPELVRVAFEAALRLDPSNDLAKRNRAAFEAFLQVPHTESSAAWEQRTVAAIRQLGAAEHPYTVAA